MVQPQHLLWRFSVEKYLLREISSQRTIGRAKSGWLSRTGSPNWSSELGLLGSCCPYPMGCRIVGKPPAHYSLWIQSHPTSAAVRANEAGAAHSVTPRRDSLPSPSPARIGIYRIGWNSIWSPSHESKVGKGEFWIELKLYKEFGRGIDITHPRSPLVMRLIY